MTVQILETVGSDHHPFDRLIGWTDRWAGDHAEQISLRVQYGTAAQPRHGDCSSFMPHPELMAALQAADLVVTQGGPMGIVEARRQGLLPIVVPRLKRFGEVVDDHQVDLCRQLAARGDIWIAETEAELHACLDRALADPGALRFEPVDALAAIAGSVANFAAAVDDLPPRRGLLGRRR